MRRQAPEPRYPTAEASIAIRNKFGWREEEWMQDWPLEVSGEISLKECLEGYELLNDDDEKFLLMTGILFAWNNDSPEELFLQCSTHITTILQRDFALHMSTIYYWTFYDFVTEEEEKDPSFEPFRITPLMRTIWEKGLAAVTRATSS